MRPPDSVRLLSVRRVFVPLAHPFTTSRGSVDRLAGVQVTVESQGERGRGIAVPATRLSGETVDSMTSIIEGPLRAAIEAIPIDAWSILLDRVAAAAPGNLGAKAAVDLAIHDLLCNRAGESIGSLLGGGSEPRVATDLSLSLAAPSVMAMAALVGVERGFQTLKLKVGMGVERDLACVRAVAAAVDHRAQLRLDANQAWSPTEAVEIVTRLADGGVELDLVEQPVASWNLRGMAWVRQRSPVPVVADESVVTPSDVVAVAEAGAADIVNIKVNKHGGLRAAQQVLAVVASVGLEAFVGSMLEPAESVACSVALAAMTPGRWVHDLDAGDWVAPEEDGAHSRTGATVRYEPPFVSLLAR